MTSFYDDTNGGMAKVGTIPIGTTKTFGTDVFQWDGTKWYPTGVKDAPAGGAPARTFEQDMALATAPRSSSSSSVSQSLSDPRALQLQQQQLDEQIRQNQVEAARAAQVFEYTKTKDAFAQSQDDKRLALQAQQQAQNAQYQMDTLKLQSATLLNQRSSLQAQMEMQAQQENARNALQSKQIDQQAEQARQQNLLKTNEDIAQFSSNPTDYGKLAAFQLANRGWGAANTAQTGANITSEESLQPLAGALQQRQGLMQPNQPTQTGQVVAPTLGAIDLAGMYQGQPQRAPSRTEVPGASLGTYVDENGNLHQAPVPGATLDPRAEANQRLEAAGVPSWVPKFENGGATGENILMAIAQMLGMTPKAIAGEKGKANGETVMSNGDVVVIPDKGKSALPKMADGGFSFGPQYDTTEAKKFQGDAFNRAVGGTPWAQGGLGGLPTSVYASSPGFSPLVAQLLGSLNAMGKGIPQQEYLRQAEQLSPLGYNQQYGHQQQIIGRSA